MTSGADTHDPDSSRPAAPTKLGVPGIVDAVEIGRGGFGVVYRGVEEELGRSVAVKVLPAGLRQRDQDRFDRERRSMGLLSGHPNIVTVYRTGFTATDQPYIIMEYLEPGSMDDLLERDGPLPWAEAAGIGVALAGAVETAHLSGVLHRDIKPGNVLISARREPKLADFGIARLEGAPETSSSVITASVAHAGPEIIDGRRPSPASDLYSLASTVYTLIAGHPPFFDADDQSIVPLMARIARDPLPPIDAEVPDAVWAALVRAMAKDPDDRHASVEAFGQELAAALDGLPSDRSTPSWPTGASQTTVVTSPPTDNPIGRLARGNAPVDPPQRHTEPPALDGAGQLGNVAVHAPGGADPNPPTRRGGRTVGLVLVGVVAVVIAAALAWSVLSGRESAALPVETAEDYDDYLTTFDSSGAIQLSLPAAWDDIDPGGSSVQASLTAAADLASALNTFSAPGVLVTVNPTPLADADSTLDELIDSTGCNDLGRGDYEQGDYSGRFHQLSGCGDVDADVWVVAAAPPDGSFTVVVSIQAVDPRDETAGRRVLDSLIIQERAVPGG